MWARRTSFAALALSLFGTFFTLWLAVLLLNSLGTCWNALVERLSFEVAMLAAIALISNSRALTKAETSRSPFLLNALSEAWARIVLAEEVLTRLAARLDDEGGMLDLEGCLRFNGPEGAIVGGGV